MMENYEKCNLNGTVKKLEIDFENIQGIKSELEVEGDATVIKCEDFQNEVDSNKPQQKENVSQKKLVYKCYLCGLEYTSKQNFKTNKNLVLHCKVKYNSQ